MGYLTHVRGEITIDPPLTWAECKNSDFYPDLARGSGKNVALRITEETVTTDEGVLTKRTADAIEPYSEDPYKAYDLVEQVQEVIDLYARPGRTFGGMFECEGEEAGDLWRVVIRDGKAVKVEAQIVWPDA